jgi:hypothetical protein
LIAQALTHARNLLQHSPTMKSNLRRTLGLVALSLALLPCKGAMASQGSASQLPLSNAHLDARHPSTLCGRGVQLVEGYVDLYAPLTREEARRLAGYRGVRGLPLPAPVPQQ